MRTSISESIISTLEDLHTDGIINQGTLNNISSLCVPGIKEYTPEKITKRRKKPRGASKKLLDLVERKGQRDWFKNR